ncbi:MAG: hypothetical protein ACREN1_07345 [Candidatus Dormibacteria bacterium]
MSGDDRPPRSPGTPIDFGGEVGLRRLGAPLTHRCRPQDLLSREVLGMVNPSF